MNLPSVLLIEDQPHTRELLGELIVHLGYRVDLAASAEEALVVLRSGHSPTVILMDLHLPGMDGWELHAHLLGNELWRSIPVIVTSAAGQHTPPPTGVAFHLPKPIDAQLLAALLERYCGRAEEPAA